MTVNLDALRAALADRYRIERELGAGGMATVFLAEDLKHARKVAVKVLRPELAAVIGADRFLQEIRLTAALQHPHILPLHDSGAGDGVLYYVMPYVEGETLRSRLDREKQFEIDEAVELARQVLSALDYAHRRGVIHRDIKPENILIHDHQALVADFGIALAVSSAGASRMTETGMSLGTPQYMSPEQAMGDRELDARSDIYSLGAMLYEMLAGDPPYTGSTAQAIVAKVITEKAALVSTHRDTVPPNVAAAIQKSLSKLPADRFHSAADFADALADPRFSTVAYATATSSPAAIAAGAAMAGPRRWLWPGVAAGFAGLALLAFLWPAPETPRAVARYRLSFAEGQQPNQRAYDTFGLATDGSWIAYVGPNAGSGSAEQLWMKRRESLSAVALPGTESSWAPVSSPDGQWLAFLSTSGSLRKMPIVGGAPLTVADSTWANNLSSIAWGDDGVLTYTDRQFRLRRVPADGGTAAVSWTPAQGVLATFPSALPDGRGVLFSRCSGNNCRPTLEVMVLDLRTSEVKLLIPGAARAWYAQTGQLVYVRADGGVFAVPFDLETLAATDAAVPVLEGIAVPNSGVAQLEVGRDGTVLYLAGAGNQGGASHEAVWVARNGAITPVDTGWRFDASGNAGWSLSPDGRRLAIKLATEAGQHIWVKQLDDGPVSRVTFEGDANIRPRWLPDGETLSYVATRADSAPQSLYTRRGDGTGPEARRLRIDKTLWEVVWSRDGKWVVLRTGGVAGSTGDRDVYVMQIGVDTVPRPLLVTPPDEKAIALSPDGRWLAYESNETGRDEVYVRPFPAVGDGKWQVSTSGGVAPLWSRTGTELFFIELATGTLMSGRPVAGSFAAVERRPLFKGGSEFQMSANYTPFDVAPDGRFLMVRSRSTSAAVRAPLILVENWFEELKAKFPK